MKNERWEGELFVAELEGTGRKLLNLAEQAVLTEDGQSKLKLKTLCIFMDKDNLLRVKTRITQSDDKIFDIQWFCTRTFGGGAL